MAEPNKTHFLRSSISHMQSQNQNRPSLPTPCLIPYCSKHHPRALPTCPTGSAQESHSQRLLVSIRDVSALSITRKGDFREP